MPGWPWPPANTCCVVAPWPPPSIEASGSPTYWVSCRRHQLSRFSHWLAEPRVAKAWVGKLGENSRSPQNARYIYSLMAVERQKGFLRWGLYTVYRTKEARGQVGTSRRACTVLCHLSCYIMMYLQNMGRESLPIATLANLLFPYREFQFRLLSSDFNGQWPKRNLSGNCVRMDPILIPKDYSGLGGLVIKWSLISTYFWYKCL